jgi:hypothetical protein
MTTVSDDTLRSTVLDALLSVAPDIDAGTLDARRTLREQFDFDSMDQLNFALALHARLGIDVPEADYPRLATLDGSIAYAAEALSKRGRS